MGEARKYRQKTRAVEQKKAELKIKKSGIDLGEVRKVFAPTTKEDQYISSLRNFSVKAHYAEKEIIIKVSQMYDYLPLSFDHMMKLAEIFGTKDFTVNQWSNRGCETCDYGSQYIHEFCINKLKLLKEKV